MHPLSTLRASISICVPVAIALLAACGDDAAPPADASADAQDGGDGAVVDAGPTCTDLVYADDDGDLTRWPEPALLVDDATTITGKRLRFVEADYPEISSRSAGFLPLFTEDLSDLDGFGVNADAFFRFGRAFDVEAVPSGEATEDPAAGLGFVVLGPDGPLHVPVEVRFGDDDTTPILSPMRPLPAATPAAVYLTRALTDAAGGCLEPSADMAAEIASPSTELAEAIDALVTLGAIESPDELVAVTAFVTQSTTEQSVAIAADIAARDYALDAPLTCTARAEWIACDGTFTAWDYRDADGVIRQDPAAIMPVSSYQLPLRVWLPLTGAPPFRTIVFGHGLGGDRTQGRQLARLGAPEGIATVAIPAVQHGEHPTNEMPGRGALGTVLEFFAIGDLETDAIDGLVLRDHFRQSTYDKLQLTRLLQAGLDADGDGVVDLDASQMAYVGASLGGIMGSELLALTDAYGAAILAVPGANVTSIISKSVDFGALIALLAPPGTTAGDVERFFPVLQTVLERGDGGSYAPHVLRDRLAGDPAAPPPSVILGVALDDDTVPNVASWSLARALDVPITPELLRPVPGVVALTESPVSGNVAGGAASAGLIQFDVIESGGMVEMATHSSTPASDVAAAAWFEFLNTHWDDGLGVIIDPYAVTGLAHAAP